MNLSAYYSACAGMSTKWLIACYNNPSTGMNDMHLAIIAEVLEKRGVKV